MRLYLLILGICCFVAVDLPAQADSVQYRPEKGMRDGLYLSYDDFRHNRAILKEQVISDLDKSQLEFLSKVLFEGSVRFTRGDSVFKVSSLQVWGYFQNNTLYVLFRDEFYRVPVFGAISYLVANVIVPNTGFFDPRFGTPVAGSTREIREFLMSFYDGRIIEFSNENFEMLLKHDEHLLHEYKKLGRKKRRESQYRFIRTYNERHPVYFLGR